jgi:hypothetical protein
VLVDGELNFRVTKRRQTRVTKKADQLQAPPSNGRFLSTEENLGAASLLTSQVEIVATVAVGDSNVTAVSGVKSGVKRESARLKRAAEVKESLGFTQLSEDSSRTARRVSRKKAVAAKPEVTKADMGLPATTARSVETATTTDFWHSSLSGRQKSGGYQFVVFVSFLN